MKLESTQMIDSNLQVVFDHRAQQFAKQHKNRISRKFIPTLCLNYKMNPLEFHSKIVNGY